MSLRERWFLYELCVQSPRHTAAFLRAVHGGRPTRLAEDFCGTAAVSRRWLIDAARAGEACTAVAADLDAEALQIAGDVAREEHISAGLELVRCDCVRAPAPEADGPADVIFIGNFSIGYIHDRDDLARYLHRCCRRLSQGAAGFGGGVLVMEVYGGPGAYLPAQIVREHPARDGAIVQYTWVHESGDAEKGMVENSISFAVERDGRREHLPRAFCYHWRLWSLGELRAVLARVGFNRVQLFAHARIGIGEQPVPIVEPPDGEDFNLVLAAWV